MSGISSLQVNYIGSTVLNPNHDECIQLSIEIPVLSQNNAPVLFPSADEVRKCHHSQLHFHCLHAHKHTHTHTHVHTHVYDVSLNRGHCYKLFQLDLTAASLLVTPDKLGHLYNASSFLHSFE